MNDHFVTNAGRARRLSITDEQQLATLEAARLERKAIRLRRAEIEQRRELARIEERAEAERRRIAHLMHAAPGASASHRGAKSTYNTADRDAVRREPDAPRERLTDGKRHPVKVARATASDRMRP